MLKINSLSDLSKELKYLIATFVIVTSIGFLSSVAFVDYSNSTTPDGLVEQYNGNESINTFRGTLWVNGRYQLFKKKIILNHESYFQPSLEHQNNFRWQADIGLELPVWKFMNFKINYLHTFESIVIENQKQEDTYLTFGVTLKNY